MERLSTGASASAFAVAAMVINIALFLVAGVHGDEISPVEAIRQSFEGLDPANMSGSVIAVFDVARPAKEFTLRKWPIAAQGDSLIDMNRMWPGKQFGNRPDAGARRGVEPDMRVSRIPTTCSPDRVSPGLCCQSRTSLSVSLWCMKTMGCVRHFTDRHGLGDLGVPDPCVLSTTLEQMLTGTTFCVRPDGPMCVACHWAERADAGVRLDDVKDKQDLIGRGDVERFVSEQSAKAPNLKRPFADWRSRGHPD